MTKLQSTTVEMFLGRGSRSWGEFFQEEVVPRKRFNDKFLVLANDPIVQRYKDIIDELFVLMGEELVRVDSRGSLLAMFSSSSEKRLAKRVRPLLDELRQMIEVPPREVQPRKRSRRSSISLPSGQAYRGLGGDSSARVLALKSA